MLLKRTLGLSHQFSNIIGRSEAMLDVFKMIETVARTNSTILLTGESGTGKGLVAQAIHFHSLRRDKPMVSLNCGAMPENAARVRAVRPHARRVHRRRRQQEGAARGRRARHRLPRRDRRDERRRCRSSCCACCRSAASGASAASRSCRPTSASSPRPTRISTRRVAEGRFREDLFYRINVIPIALPPLRERREDIPLLAEHFLAKYTEQMGKEIAGHLARGDGAARAPRLAGQHPRARERDRARGGARSDADDPAGQPARRRSAATRRRSDAAAPPADEAARTGVRPRSARQGDRDAATSPRRSSAPAASR